MMATKRDFYEVLGVGRDAGGEEIKRAWLDPLLALDRYTGVTLVNWIIVLALAIVVFLLIALALAISASVWRWVQRERGGVMMQLSAGLLVGGALGNVVDRITWGAVVDFINVTCCGINNPYAFNLADIAIFAGAFGLILFSGPKKDP